MIDSEKICQINLYWRQKWLLIKINKIFKISISQKVMNTCIQVDFANIQQFKRYIWFKQIGIQSAKHFNIGSLLFKILQVSESWSKTITDFPDLSWRFRRFFRSYKSKRSWSEGYHYQCWTSEFKIFYYFLNIFMKCKGLEISGSSSRRKLELVIN